MDRSAGLEGPGPARAPRWAWALVAGLYAWVLAMGWLRHNPDYPFNVDAAQDVWVSWKVAQGEFLYRDIPYAFGPFAPYLNAAGIRLLPSLPPIESIRLLETLNLLACGLLAHRIASRFFPRGWLPLLQAVFLVGIGVPGAVGMQSGLWTAYLTGYAYGVAWGLLAVWAALKAAEGSGAWSACLAGVALAGAATSKVDAIAPAFLAAAAVAFLRRGRERWAPFAICAALLIAVAAAFRQAGAGWREILEAVVPVSHQRELAAQQPRWAFVDPDGIRGALYLALAAATGWLWSRRGLPAARRAGLVAGAAWIALAAAERWHLPLRLTQAHLAAAGWGYIAWAFWPGSGASAADRVLAAGAAGCWGRYAIEFASLPLGWGKHPLSPLLLLASVRFWTAAFPFWRGRIPGEAPGGDLLPKTVRTGLAVLLCMGMVRQWRLTWRQEIRRIETPMGILRVEAAGAGPWLEAVARCRAWREKEEGIVQIPGSDLLLAVGQPPPLPFPVVDPAIQGGEERVIERLRADASIRHVVLVYRDREEFWFGHEYGAKVADHLDADWEIESIEGKARAPFRLLTRERQRLAGDRLTIYYLRRKGG